MTDEEQNGYVRPVTLRLFENLILDMPLTPASILDFGVVTQEHHRVLQNGVREGSISLADLEAALGDGRELTDLVNRAGCNPRNIYFVTEWDCLQNRAVQGEPPEWSKCPRLSSRAKQKERDYEPER